MESRQKLLKPINTRRTENAETKLEEEEPLTPWTRLFHTPQFNCCVIAVLGFKTTANVEAIIDGFMRDCTEHPRFSSKLVLNAGKGCKPTGWIRSKVSPNDHIIVPNVDPNMDSPDKFLEDYISNITKSPMELTKPLWEFHILKIKTKEASSIGIFRIHHSLGDGVSLISLLLACTRRTSNPDALPTLPTNAKKSNTSNSPFAFFGLWVFIFKLFWNTSIDLVKFVATTLWLKDTNTPLKGAPGTETTSKPFVYRSFSLDDVKVVKKALDVTINDVLLGITQAGLSYYLNRKYGEMKGEGKAKEDNLPKHIRLRSTLLVNLRPTSTVEDLAEKLESGKTAGNAIGYVILPFKITLRDDPVDYILNVKAAMDKKKQSLEAPCTHAAIKITLKTLGLTMFSALTYRVLSHATLTFSNVVGPKEEVSFYGHPITFLAPSVYGHPQVLTVHYQSYMDKITLVLAVDPNVIPDFKRLCDDIKDSLRLVNNAVIFDKKLV